MSDTQPTRTPDIIQVEHDQAIAQLGATVYQIELLKAQENQLKNKVYALNKEYDQVVAQTAVDKEALAKAESKRQRKASKKVVETTPNV